MLLSTQTAALLDGFGYEGAIRMLARAGFDAFDFSMGSRMRDDENDPLNRPDYAVFARRLRDVADACGIVCNQAHAPFHQRFGSDALLDAEMEAKIVRAMEIASILGAPNIIVHPMKHIDPPYTQRLKTLNMAFFHRLLPYCERFGIHIALENLSVCDTPEAYVDYLDTLDSPWFVACLDVGHASLFHERRPEPFVYALGSRLRALHVHDNDLQKDLHTLPFLQKIDFAAFTRSLREAGYAGDFTFEADAFLRCFPDALKLDALKLMCATGRYLCAMVEK